MERIMAIDTQIAVVPATAMTTSASLTKRRARYARPSAIKTSSQTTTTTQFLALQFWLYSASYLIATLISNKGADCARLPDIYWNSSNPIFRIDNTDHIFDVNRKQHDHDQVDLVCPGQQHNQTSGSPDERYIIYSVSKDEYDTCRLTSEAPRVVAVCDQPPAGKPTRPPFTVTFRSFTPQPNGLEFKPGLDYYFITASLAAPAGDVQRRFAPCREHNMRVIFKVCCKSASPQATSGGSATNPLQSLANRLLSMPANNPSTGAGAAKKATPAAPHQQPMPASFVTLRPSLARAAAASEQQQQVSSTATNNNNLKAFEDFFGNAPSSSPQTAPAKQQPEPITVLPIEVLQQPQLDSSQPPASQVVQDEQERNDILPNDQQQPGAAPVAPRPPPPPSQRQTGGQQFVPFDPRAPPHIIRNYERYTPTPLPVHYHQGAHQQQQQPSLARHRAWPAPSSVESAGSSWQLPPLQRLPVASLQAPPSPHHLQPQVRNAPSYATAASSNPKLSLYPWHNSYDSSSAGMITASQSSAAASARAPHPLTCLLATACSTLALLVASAAARRGA